MQTYGANYTLMGMSLTCFFGRWEKGLSGSTYQKETGLFWQVLSVKTAKGAGLEYR